MEDVKSEIPEAPKGCLLITQKEYKKLQEEIYRLKGLKEPELRIGITIDSPREWYTQPNHLKPDNAYFKLYLHGISMGYTMLSGKLYSNVQNISKMLFERVVDKLNESIKEVYEDVEEKYGNPNRELRLTNELYHNELISLQNIEKKYEKLKSKWYVKLFS